MLIARLVLDGSPRYAVADDSRYMLFAGDPMFGSLELSGQFVAHDEAQLVSPMIPRSKAVGFTGVFHESEPERLGVYLKPNTAVVGPDTPLGAPKGHDAMDVIPQVAAVISRPCRQISPSAAAKVVFGYTLALVGRRPELGPVRAEAFDASLTLGPYINTEFDPASADVQAKVGDDERLRFSMKDAKVAPAELIAYASTLFTLLPGDIVLLGAPAGNYTVKAPKTMVAQADGIGELASPVIEAD